MNVRPAPQQIDCIFVAIDSGVPVGRLKEEWKSGTLGQSYLQCCKARATQSEPSNQGVLAIEFVELKIGCSPGSPHYKQDNTGFKDGEQHFLVGPDSLVPALVRNKWPVFELLFAQLLAREPDVSKCNFPSYPSVASISQIVIGPDNTHSFSNSSLPFPYYQGILWHIAAFWANRCCVTTACYFLSTNCRSN